MAEAEEADPQPPEWLKMLPPDQWKNNFDHTDVIWTGASAKLDPDALIRAAQPPYTFELFQIIRAIIAGHRSELRDSEVNSLSHQICNKIVGWPLRVDQR